LEKDLRIKSARDLQTIGFDGYAVGGLSVGESEQEMYKCLDYITNELPIDRPRYLMGVGRPENIINAVKRGVDMFDCVIPTREARHGRLYFFTGKGDLWTKPKSIYKTENIRLEKFKEDFKPINKNSIFPELRMYSMAYLRHLFVTEEPLAIRLATLNNLEFYLGLMEKIRNNI
jgi:queuine tRNA-ribosyltransferase